MEGHSPFPTEPRDRAVVGPVPRSVVSISRLNWTALVDSKVQQPDTESPEPDRRVNDLGYHETFRAGTEMCQLGISGHPANRGDVAPSYGRALSVRNQDAAWLHCVMQ
jgi:hypothetical protein